MLWNRVKSSTRFVSLRSRNASIRQSDGRLRVDKQRHQDTFHRYIMSARRCRVIVIDFLVINDRSLVYWREYSRCVGITMSRRGIDFRMDFLIKFSTPVSCVFSMNTL